MDTMNGPRISYPRMANIDDPYVYNKFDKQALPRQFVQSMKTLFNILDDSKTGYVSLSDIERRWRSDAVPNLPGVLECLRIVAPPDGFLSFNYFVTGLKLALCRARQTKLPKPDRVSSEYGDYGNAYQGHTTNGQYRVSPSYAQYRLNGNDDPGKYF